MKVLAFIALVAVAAASRHGHQVSENVIPDLFEGPREYVYNYRSLVATGLPLQSQRYAGLEKYGVLTVQVQEQQGNTKVLGLRLGHVMSGSFDKEVEDVENRRIEGISHSTEESIERYGPVFVKYQDNEVQQLKAPQGMPEEIINIYRGISAVFTVGKPEDLEGDSHPFMYQDRPQKQQGDEQPIVYRRNEQGITGNFETIYEILSDPEQSYGQLNVTKTRNYMKQIGRDGRFVHSGHDERGCKNVCLDHKPEQLDKNMQPETSEWTKPATEGCPVGFHPKKELVEAFTTYQYNMTVKGNGKFALIEEAKALGKKILPLRKQQIMTVSLIKLQLVEQRQLSQRWPQQDATKQYEDITYRFPEEHKLDVQHLSLYKKPNTGEMIKDQILPMIKALSEVIVSDNIELKSQTGDRIVQLTRALAVLDKKELETLWVVLGQPVSPKTGTDLEKVQRKVFIDTVGLSGSNDGAEFLVELIRKQQLWTLETVDALETLQKNLIRPRTNIMNQLLQLITDGKFQEKRTIFSTAAIAFAEIVRGNCGNYKTYQWQKQQQQDLKEQTDRPEQMHYCGQQEYKQFVDAIRGQLHSAKDFTQQTVYIQTLGRLAHPEAIKALIPYVHGEREVIAQVEKMTRNDQHEDNSEYTQFLRQVAIYALHHAAKRHGTAIEPIVQGIYFNKQEDYEIRIAALSVLLATQPAESTYGRIVIELGREHDQEVASYAYSALRSIANSTLPCMKQSARRVQNVLGGLPKNYFGAHLSKWATYTQYFPLANLGFKGQWEVTQSNVSAIPRFIYSGITANKGPFVSTVGELGMIAKGFENLDKFILRKGGMNKIVENVVQRIRRDARILGGDETVQKMLEQIEGAMQFNTEENNEQPRGVLFGNMFGNELYLPVDKEYMTKVAQKAGERIVSLLREEGSEKTFRLVRVLMPRTYIHVAPGVNGLPVMLVNRHPIVVSVALKDLQTRFGAEKGQTKLQPFVAAVSAFIQPTVYHTSIHTAMVINPVEQSRTAYGVRAIEQTYLTLPIDGALQYTHQTKTVAFTLRPRFEKIFFHKTRLMTFKTEHVLIRHTDKPVLDQYTSLKTQQKPFEFDRVFGEKLGMALRVQGISMNDKYAVDFFRSNVARQQGITTAITKFIGNHWFLPRTWSVRVENNEQKPVEEIKMVVRLGNLLKDRVRDQEGQPKKQIRLSQEQLSKEQAYPEHMRMIAYEQEFEKITGRKPETETLEQALDRVVRKTEKYWSQVDGQLRQKFNKENVQVRSVEYVIAAKGQKKQIPITGHVILGSTLSKRAKLAEIKMNVEDRPFYFEAQAVAAFTKAPQPFETEIREEEQRGIVGFVAELETRQTGKQQYAGKIQMQKSEEQKQLMRRGVQQKPWYYRQCEDDKQEGLSEVSTACDMTRHQKSALDQINFEIELPEEVHERLVNVSHKIRDSLKARLYRNLQATYDSRYVKTQEKKLQGELIYSERLPEMSLANLTIRTPDYEELRFVRLAVPKALRPNTMWFIKDQVKALFKNDLPEQTCVYNGENLNTFDNVTISLEAMKEGKKYIIARDNDEKSKFTILAQKKQSSQKAETEVELLLRDATYIKLTPAGQQGQYKVRVNQTSLEVSANSAEAHQYGSKGKHVITFHVQEHKEGQDTLVVKVRDQRLRIIYDGQNFKIVVAKRQLKGQLTGLCGNMNNQYLDELTGPRGCNFEREEDFVRAFSLDKEQPKQMEGQWTCPEGVHPRGASQQDISRKKQHMQMVQKMQQEFGFHQPRWTGQHGEHIVEETKMFPYGDKVCFSTEPLQTCESGYRQRDTGMQHVGFKCLPAHLPLTTELQREVQVHKVLNPEQLPYGVPTIYREVEVPARCGN